MKKRSEIRVPAKAGAWYIVSSAFIKLVGMALTPLYTGMMSAGEYGTYSLYMSWIAIFSVISTLGLSGSSVYRGMQRFSDEREELISGTLGLSLVSVSLFAVGSVIFTPFFTGFTGLSEELLSLLTVQLAADAAVTVYTSKCRYLYRYKSAVFVSIAGAVLSQGLSVLFITVFERSAETRALALLLGTLAVSLPLLLLALRRSCRLFSRRVWSFLLKFNLPLIPHYLSSALLSSSDKVIISSVSGDAALAKYSVAHSLGVGMSFVTNGLGSALQPWIMRKIETGREDAVSRLSFRICMLIATGSLILLSLAPELLGLLAPASYGDALLSVYPITLSAVFGFVSSVSGTAILHSERTSLLSVSAIAGAAVNIGANLIFIPISYNGAAFGYLLAAAVSAVINVIASARALGKRVIPPLRCSVLFAAAAALSLILYALRGLLVLRLGLLLILALLAFLILFRLKAELVE